MVDESWLRLAASDSHLQRVDDELCAFGLAEVDRGPDGRDVTRGQPVCDASHSQLPSLIERQPSGERPPWIIICWYSSVGMPVIVLTACR